MQEIHIDIFLNILKGSALALLVIWTIAANILVFVVLYKNPHLQTVPNLLVANLAFSDLCLGIVVLPLSSIYAIANEWLFTSTVCIVFVSADILCSTASIWNLSIVGLDRYWAITTPMAYMAKRNKRTAAFLILSVWVSSALISLAPLFGWRQIAERGNMIKVNGTWQCVFLDLPSYTIYSATGSFFIPLIIMFFVYYKIYQTFAKHRARQLYRQQVIKKHIESTILHDLSHVLPVDEKFTEEVEKNEETEVNSTRNICKRQHVPPICKECEDYTSETANEPSSREVQIIQIDAESGKRKVMQDTESHKHQKRASGTAETPARIAITTNNTIVVSENNIAKGKRLMKCRHCGKTEIRKMHLVQSPNTISDTKVTYKKRHQSKRQKIVSQYKPKIISTAKERRGVKVFGIILGCFAICWTPFFMKRKISGIFLAVVLQSLVSLVFTWRSPEIQGLVGLSVSVPLMYVVVQFCSSCKVDSHIWMFITWLGYSNSAMNPIIYTVFNHDYQNALKGLFRGSKKQAIIHVKR